MKGFLGIYRANGDLFVSVTMADQASFERTLLALRIKDWTKVRIGSTVRFDFPPCMLSTVEAAFDLWIEHFETGEIIN